MGHSSLKEKLPVCLLDRLLVTFWFFIKKKNLYVLVIPGNPGKG